MIPLFKSHYSIGKSILTLDKPSESVSDGPDSIIDIAVKEKINDVFLIEDNFGGFIKAYNNLKEYHLNLIFGIKFRICSDVNDKTDESFKTTSKIIILAKNNSGYKRLSKLYSLSYKQGYFKGFNRLDYKTLKEHWNEKELKLCIPFYDSFLYYNTLRDSYCVPEINFTTPTFFVEDNNLPFDYIIEQKIKNYCNSEFPILKTKSIYYNKKEDFIAYLTYRCITDRKIGKTRTLSRPEFNHMSSSDFCVESWKEFKDE